MSPAPLTRAQPAGRMRRPATWRWPVVVGSVAAVILLSWGLSRLLHGSTFVRQLTFSNPTPYALDVEIGSAGHDSWLALGGIPPQATAAFQEVIDQGRVWKFRFSSQGVAGGQITRPRSELAGAQFTVVIPT